MKIIVNYSTEAEPRIIFESDCIPSIGQRFEYKHAPPSGAVVSGTVSEVCWQVYWKKSYCGDGLDEYELMTQVHVYVD